MWTGWVLNAGQGHFAFAPEMHWIVARDMQMSMGPSVAESFTQAQFNGEAGLLMPSY